MSALIICKTLLRADAGLAALVGANSFPVEAPQGAMLPYIAFRPIAESEDQLLDGAGSYFETRVEITICAATALAADQIGEAVKRALGDVRLRALDDGASPPAIIARQVTCWKAGADISDASADRAVFRRVMDFELRWKTPA